MVCVDSIPQYTKPVFFPEHGSDQDVTQEAADLAPLTTRSMPPRQLLGVIQGCAYKYAITP
jgi:hypothetical protein